MKSIRKIVAVTLVTALCFIACCVPASAVMVNSEFSYEEYFNKSFFVPSPDYPTLESLPYGSDTLIYEIPRKVDGGVKWYRVYMKRELYHGSDYSIFNGTTALLSAEPYDVCNFNFQFISSSNIYYQNYTVLDDDLSAFEFSDIVEIDFGNVVDGVTYPSLSIQGILNGTPTWLVGHYSPRYISNGPAMLGGFNASDVVVASFPEWQLFDYINLDSYVSYNNPTRFRYPSASDLDAMRSAKLEGSLGDINDSINQGVEEIIGSVDNASGEIQTAIYNAVGEILNGAEEVPTVDTDNSWMNDSITQMNEWLSELEAFEEQMKQNEEENSENMAQASAFVNGFFDIIPTALVSIVTLGLVMIVVIKIVGR